MEMHVDERSVGRSIKLCDVRPETLLLTPHYDRHIAFNIYIPWVGDGDCEHRQHISIMQVKIHVGSNPSDPRKFQGLKSNNVYSAWWTNSS